MMRALVTLPLMLLSTAPLAQIAPTPNPVTVSVPDTASAMRLLGAIDVPLTPHTVSAVGLTEALATKIAESASETRYMRMRAIGALGLIGTQGARATVEALALNDRDENVRVEAIINLARAFSPVTAHPALARLQADPSAKISARARRELKRLKNRKPR